MALLMVTGCKKEDTTPGFDMLYQQDFTIQPGLGPFVTHHFYLKNIDTRYASLLDQYGKTDEEVIRILPVQAAVAGIFGDANFNVVEEASLRIYQESDPNGYIEVAYRFPTPIDPSNTLDLIPTLADAKRILKEDRFSIDLAIRLRSTTADEMPVRLSLKMKANY
ncbi:MAG: hypothetical protein EP344_17390 [Bacteroidetes bacterium]|nr:MAG: hypothetical protein EP344_17390 [Bacteroidota bacterium]